MDTEQINYVLRRDKRTAAHFLGTFPVDYLPVTLGEFKFFICNEEPHIMPGLHWLLWAKGPKRNPLTFFDSYGRQPYTAALSTFAKRNAEHGLVCNRKQLQSSVSNVCGLYCCVFALFHVYYSYSVTQFAKIFRSSPEENDCLIQRFFQTEFGSYLTLRPTITTKILCQRSKPVCTYRYTSKKSKLQNKRHLNQ